MVGPLLGLIFFFFGLFDSFSVADAVDDPVADKAGDVSGGAAGDHRDHAAVLQ